jgi:ubiquinone/menaquinone biosynthesis C-methylase UbiE
VGDRPEFLLIITSGIIQNIECKLMPVYDSIGQSYSKFRLPDPRILDSLLNLLQLEPGSIIADIGAGTGGYSRAIAEQGFFLYAVEPSSVMRSQSIKHSRVQWFTGFAENIPLLTSSVDAVISVLAIHHFSNLENALSEMNRVARRGALIILTFDPSLGKKFWLKDYFPFIWEDAERIFPPLYDIVTLIQKNTQRTVEASPLMLPHDLSDMFLAAGWRRPEIYLNSEVRAGMSAFTLANFSVVEKGVKLLEEDLNSGKWDTKYGEVRKLKQIDVGYRFLCAKVLN